MYILENKNGLNLLYNGKLILQNIKLCAKINGTTKAAEIRNIKKEGDAYYVSFSYDTETFKTLVTFSQNEKGISINIKADFEKVYLMPEISSLDPDEGIILSFGTDLLHGFLARYMETRWWSYTSFDTIPERTQSLLVNCDGTHICFSPQCAGAHRAQLRGNGKRIEMYIGSECMGYNSLEGDYLLLSCGDTPHESIERNTVLQTQRSGFITPLKKDKRYPEFMKGIGWCTWNAFYHDVTAEKIESKLKEFREKGIKLGWLIIDDGWAKTKDWKIASLIVDREKFPEGLGEFVKRIKREYGVEYVGIWHSMMAYWWGVEENSELDKEYSDCFMKTNADIIMPDFRKKNKALRFFNDWHKYLKSCGIDFLKVDTQGEMGIFLRGNCSVPESFRNAHEIIEKSVHQNFNDEMINCMGMGNESFGVRRYTSLTRSSDDFYPNKDGSFAKHIKQNVYNSLFYDDFYYCDFDMWWTNRSSAVQSAVLRAVSGGPIYISDELGDTNADMLIPIADENWNVHRCDSAALPVRSQTYNPGEILKIMNSAGDCDIVAAFNLSDSVLNTEIVFDDLKKGIAEEYIAYLYFERKFLRFDKKSKFNLQLSPGACETICFYPIKDGCIMLGNTEKYVSALYNPVKTSIDDLNIEK